MPNDLLIILLGATMILGASIGTRYFVLRRGATLGTARIVTTITAACTMSLLLLLGVGATWDKVLVFSAACTFVIGAYLFLRKKLVP